MSWKEIREEEVPVRLRAGLGAQPVYSHDNDAWYVKQIGVGAVRSLRYQASQQLQPSRRQQGDRASLQGIANILPHPEGKQWVVTDVPLDNHGLTYDVPDINSPTGTGTTIDGASYQYFLERSGQSLILFVSVPPKPGVVGNGDHFFGRAVLQDIPFQAVNRRFFR